MTKKTSALARLALFLTAMIWGSSFFIVKNSIEVFPLHLLIGVRFLVAAVLLGAVFFPRLLRASRKCVGKGLVIGVLLFLSYKIQTMGLELTTPGKSAFLTSVYCVLVPFLYWAAAKKRPQLNHVFAAFLLIAGVALVSLSDSFSIGAGDAMTLLSGVLFAVHIVSVATLGAGEDPVVFTIMQFASCAALGFAFGLPQETWPASVSPDALWGLGYIALISTAVALLLQMVGQKNTDPSVASIILSLESVFGVLFSVLFFGETLTPRLVSGFALIFAAVLLSEARLPRRQKAETTELG